MIPWIKSFNQPASADDLFDALRLVLTNAFGFDVESECAYAVGGGSISLLPDNPEKPGMHVFVMPDSMYNELLNRGSEILDFIEFGVVAEGKGSRKVPPPSAN